MVRKVIYPNNLDLQAVQQALASAGVTQFQWITFIQDPTGSVLQIMMYGDDDQFMGNVPTPPTVANPFPIDNRQTQYLPY